MNDDILPVKAKTYNGRLCDLHHFLKWAQKAKIGLVAPGTFDLSLLEYEDEDPPSAETISPDALDRLLMQAAAGDPHQELCVSLQAHQGVRTKEVDRTRFYMLKLEEEEIVYPKRCLVTNIKVTKGGRFRQFDMHAAFRRRLKRFATRRERHR
jgi:hypothetical protein